MPCSASSKLLSLRVTVLDMRRGSVLSALLAALALAPAALARPVLARIQFSATLRVCIWPDYYGVTFRNPRTQLLVGIDIDLSAELARDLGVKRQYVESSFPKLIDDLSGDRCDIAMHAVGVLPARAEKLKFSQPYLQSDIYGVTTRSARLKNWDDIDKPGDEAWLKRVDEFVASIKRDGRLEAAAKRNGLAEIVVRK